MRLQFRLSKVFLLILVFAMAFAVLRACNMSVMQEGLAISIVTLFAGVDLLTLRLGDDVDRGRDTSTLCAYYVTAFAFATLECMLGFLAAPFPESSIVGKSTLASAFAPVVRVVAITLIYISVFAVLSSTAFAVSLVAFRRCRTARWLLAINCIGVAIVVLYGLALAIE